MIKISPQAGTVSRRPNNHSVPANGTHYTKYSTPDICFGRSTHSHGLFKKLANIAASLLKEKDVAPKEESMLKTIKSKAIDAVHFNGLNLDKKRVILELEKYRECLKVKTAESVRVKGSGTIGIVDTPAYLTLGDSIKVLDNIKGTDVLLQDSAYAKNIEADSIMINDVGSAEKTKGRFLTLNDNAKVHEAESTEILMNENAHITNAYPVSEMEICGDSTVDDIVFKKGPNIVPRLIIRENAQIKGKIIFENSEGHVIIKDPSFLRDDQVKGAEIFREYNNSYYPNQEKLKKRSVEGLELDPQKDYTKEQIDKQYKKLKYKYNYFSNNRSNEEDTLIRKIDRSYYILKEYYEKQK